MIINRGDVFQIELANNGEHVQTGKRYCVVVQNELANKYSPVAIVIPLTTQMKRLDLKTHIVVANQLPALSVALCEQIITVDKSMLKNFVATLDNTTMKAIDEALRLSLGI